MSLESIYLAFLSSSGVCTDTRSISQDCMFFALKGDNFNGNHYAKEALAAGARYVVVDEDLGLSNDQYFLVDDVLTTLQKLATRHRLKLNFPVLAITGSNGKTTTKELIREVLSAKFNVHATVGNFNNHIGVPLTLLQTTVETEIAIIEMGANHIGEIAALCDIARPDFGLITNIGRAHLEGFGNLEGVIRAKSELYQYLIINKGVAFINSQNEILKNMAKRFRDPIFYPSQNDNYHCEFISAEPFVHIKTAGGVAIETQLVGTYNFENIAAALCIGHYFSVPESEMVKAIANYLPSNNRSQVVSTASNTIILDAYNANPNSMKAALQNFNQMKANKKVAILGDMFELGEESEDEHNKIGQLLIDALSMRLRQYEMRQKHLSLLPAPERIIDSLLLTAYKFGDKTERGLELSICNSRKDLASFSNTSQEQTIRTLRKLHLENIISIEGKCIIISDVDKLVAKLKKYSIKEDILEEHSYCYPNLFY